MKKFNLYFNYFYFLFLFSSNFVLFCFLTNIAGHDGLEMKKKRSLTTDHLKTLSKNIKEHVNYPNLFYKASIILIQKFNKYFTKRNL